MKSNCTICGWTCHPDDLTSMWYYRLCLDCVTAVDQLLTSRRPKVKVKRRGTEYHITLGDGRRHISAEEANALYEYITEERRFYANT